MSARAPTARMTSAWRSCSAASTESSSANEKLRRGLLRGVDAPLCARAALSLPTRTTPARAGSRQPRPRGPSPPTTGARRHYSTIVPPMSAVSAIPYLIPWDAALLASAPATLLGREIPVERLTRVHFAAHRSGGAGARRGRLRQDGPGARVGARGARRAHPGAQGLHVRAARHSADPDGGGARQDRHVGGDRFAGAGVAAAEDGAHRRRSAPACRGSRARRRSSTT